MHLNDCQGHQTSQTTKILKNHNYSCNLQGIHHLFYL